MSTDFAKVKAPARERLFLLLSDLDWHGYEELHQTGGVRYSARLLELKRLGYSIETAGEKEQGLKYRLTSHDRGKPKSKRVKVFLLESDARTLLGVASREHGLADAKASLEDAINSFEANRYKL